MHLINCEVEIDLKLTKNCVLIEEDDNVTGATFTITSTKLYVPVVTFSINDYIKFLENIRQGFKRTISWNKYKSEIIAKPKNNNLDYLIDPTFRNVYRLFVLSFKNGEDYPSMNYFFKYFIPLVEIKYFNVLVDNKPFFDQPAKNKQEVYEELIEMSRNDDYTTGFYIIKIIINFLALIYQDKQIRVFLNKLITGKFLLLKSSKKLF